MKRTKSPTLDQVIRDAVNVQARLRKEGILIEFSMRFMPPPEKPKKQLAPPATAAPAPAK
jgi:hypothetical protein